MPVATALFLSVVFWDNWAIAAIETANCNFGKGLMAFFSGYLR
ncbi:hypothetical protein NWP17_06135 [Chrysosporum bergii ANA360D]|uniref:Uncharacterized protein n=1 Tax=Chrysosporum bergii ANA360D TaxID=617107 RepID=A0AA43GSB0_9CYAN|nr:hypothetical protein [Chrysosporum bergii]MDH6060018.1 hypothetical protein [Chrysosporum bergii ANA360D]